MNSYDSFNDCCNNGDPVSSLLNSQSSPQCNCPDPINRILNNLDDELCDMRVTLAETKANLLFLAQTLCCNHCLTQTEKFLLLAIEKQLKKLGCNINDLKGISDQLDCLLH